MQKIQKCLLHPDQRHRPAPRNLSRRHTPKRLRLHPLGKINPETAAQNPQKTWDKIKKVEQHQTFQQLYCYLYEIVF